MQIEVHLSAGEKLIEKIARAIEIVYDPIGDKKAYKTLI